MLTPIKNELYIYAFEVVLPANHLSQSRIIEWTLKSHRRAETLMGRDYDPAEFEDKLRRFCLNEKHISQRYFEIEEVDENWDEHAIYRLTKESPNGAPIEERNLFFGEKANKVFHQLYAKKTPRHIIHVTCTGYISPSPAQVYFSTRENAPAITHAYHMGCYASLPAIRMAMGLSLSEGNSIDVVHTEMCSLHLSPSVHSPEQMVVQTLFADGHIKYSVGRNTEKNPSSMKILAVHEKMVPDTLGDMTWIPASHGMKMTLSREVPFKIRDSLPGFIVELCEKAGIKKEEILRDAIFAIHPGGPKIIDAVQKKLELADDQVSLSRKVLFERGNMSSATLPHVWNEILNSKPKPGTRVLSFAFGPGLTIFGSIFEIAG